MKKSLRQTFDSSLIIPLSFICLVQLNLAITEVKGLINFICYRRIFVIANI